MVRLFWVLAAAALFLTGCTLPPYHGQDKSQEEMMADYRDCYSLASLEANTPPYPDGIEGAIGDKTKECMAARGYKKWLF